MDVETKEEILRFTQDDTFSPYRVSVSVSVSDERYPVLSWVMASQTPTVGGVVLFIFCPLSLWERVGVRVTEKENIV